MIKSVLFLAALSAQPVVCFRNGEQRWRRKTLSQGLTKSENNSISESLTNELFSERYRNVIPSWLLQRCEEVGWTRLSPIQLQALDATMVDRVSNVLVRSETGSGKTLCYMLPALAAIDPERTSLQALVVVPTRELGLQVSRVARRLASGYRTESGTKLLVMSVLQGSENRRQRAWAWAEPPHMVIGTPGELLKMIKHGALKRLQNIKVLVVDEADACLMNKGGSLQLPSTAVHELLSKHLSFSYSERVETESSPRLASKKPIQSENQRQTILASATVPQLHHFIKQCYQNKWTASEPLLVTSSHTTTGGIPLSIDHGFIACQSEGSKFSSLRRLMLKLSRREQNFKALVFCDNRRPLEDMAVALSQDIHSDRMATCVLRYEDSLSQRDEAVQMFRETEGDRNVVLFAPDIAARGLDIDDITHVVNYDIPDDSDKYVHRAGRTGRLGRSGVVISIVSKEQEFVLQRLANKLSLTLRCIARQQEKDTERA